MLFSEGSGDQDISEGYLSHLRSLTTSVSSHEETLRSLKSVPTILQTMATKMGVPVDGNDVQNDVQSDCSQNDRSMLGNSEGSNDDFISQMINQDITNDEDNVLDDELMQALKDCEKGLEVGPEVLKSVADAYNRTVRRPLSKETVTGLTEKMKIPANCKDLMVPKVNAEIWTHLPTKAKLNDLSLQSLQQIIGFALTSLTVASNEIANQARSQAMQSKTATKLLQLNMDAANMLGNGFQNITSKRKSEIKPFLHGDFAGICSDNIQPTQFLFGDDLKETLKNTKTTSMVMKQTFSRKVFRGKPYDYRASSNSVSRGNYSHPAPLNRQRPPWQSAKRGGGTSYQRYQNSRPRLPQLQQRRQ